MGVCYLANERVDMMRNTNSTESETSTLTKYYPKTADSAIILTDDNGSENTSGKTLKDKMYAQNAEDLFKCIPMKMEMFYTKFEKYMEIPIFKYYDAYQIFQRISCANNEDIVSIRECLMKRAKKYTKELEPEIENLTKLKNIIDTYLAGKDIGIKIVMLQEFSNDLDTILKIYKNEPTLEGMQIQSSNVE